MSEPIGTGEVLELRVHGVSGTPPQDLLDRPLVDQVAGDRIAGFHRPRLHEERTDDAPNPFAPGQPGAPELAAYNWGGLTSGSRGRALWLMLLPLTLANIAPRARPAGPSATSLGVRVLWYLSRVLALSLTCLYVVTGIGMGQDLVAWQCSGKGNACSGASPDFVFHDLGYEHRLSIEHMLLIGVAVPVVQLLLMWVVSSRTANRYERTVVDQKRYTLSATEPTVPAETPLSSPDMWDNAAPVRRLRALHMQTGFALVLWSVTAVDEGPRSHWYELRGHWWSLAPLAVLVYALLALWAPSFTGPRHRPGWQRGSYAVWTLLAVAGAVQVLGLAVVHRWVDDGFLTSVPRSVRAKVPEAVESVHRTPVGGLPYYSGTVLVVAATAIGVLVLLVAHVVVLRILDRRAPTRPTGDHRPVQVPLLGCATAAFAALAVFLAAAFSAGTYMFVASWLDTGSLKPSYRDVAHVYENFTVPAVVATANVTYALAVAALAAIVVVGAIVVVLRITWFPGGWAQLAADHPAHDTLTPSDETRARARQIRRALYLGRLVDRASWFVAAMVLSGGLLVAWFSIGLMTNHAQAPDDVFGGPATGWRSAASLGATGTYLTVFTVIGLIGLGSLAFRIPGTRRTVAILWDVAAFWPRLCHPLAAPCYAERTVPDLVTFITDQRVRRPGAGIVLAAHSQGTVIGAAVVRQLATYDAGLAPDQPVQVVPRLAFLSFGCVLRRLYGRFFPAWFGPAELHELERVLGGGDGHRARWINLWRYTDYLGGQVTDGPPQVIVPVTTPPDPEVAPTEPAARGPVDWEWHSPDPSSFERRPGDTTFTVPGRHSDFWADESGYFQLAAARLADSVRTPSAPDE